MVIVNAVVVDAAVVVVVAIIVVGVKVVDDVVLDAVVDTLVSVAAVVGVNYDATMFVMIEGVIRR